MEVSVYWWVEQPNFGDLLTPALIKNYGLNPVHNPYIEVAQVIAIGSVLQVVPSYFQGHIVGAGLIEDCERRFPRANIWGVRGELTRQRIGAPRHVVLGDPGLLSSHLLGRRESKRFVLGIVPHYIDKNDARVSAIRDRYPDDVVVIDPCREPTAVLRQIDQCEYVISSSLHGIVAADSLGIPSAWTPFSGHVFGEGFKFHDYASALNAVAQQVEIDGTESLSELIALTRTPPETVEDTKMALDGMFRMLRRCFPM